MKSRCEVGGYSFLTFIMELQTLGPKMIGVNHLSNLVETDPGLLELVTNLRAWNPDKGCAH